MSSSEEQTRSLEPLFL